jgi:hypothetical protein
MGFLDALFGGGKQLKGPAPDRLFALSTAHVTLDISHQIVTAGSAGIVFQPLGTADFGRIADEMVEVLEGTGKETGTTIETADDSFGYRWMVLRDADIEDLVVGVNAVSDALNIGGYGDRVLAAVFAFKDGRGEPIYFIYNYKRGFWYPFVPAGREARNAERELQVSAIVSGSRGSSPEIERRFPLWGIPL